MKTFDIKRFMQLCRWSAFTYRKEYFTAVITMTVMYFIALFVRFNLTWYPEFGDYAMASFCDFAVGILLLIFSFSGSFLLDNMKTKQQRLMFKLLPASDIEKFLVRYIYVTLFLIVGCVAAFCIADALRQTLSLITGHGMQATAIPFFFSSLAENMTFGNSNDIYDVILSVEMTLFTHSLYLLGGTFFRRRQFVLTSVVMILGGILMAWVISWFYDSFSLNLTKESLKGFVYFIMCLLPVLIASAYWLSFRLFKRTQVVNNKWINL